MASRCAHERSEIRRRIQGNGGIAYWRQCLECFQTVGTAIRHADAPADAPPFDEDARDDYWRKIGEAFTIERIKREQQREHEQEARQQAYLDYLATEAWHRKREAVLARDAYICQAQLDGCIRRASQVHHKTYEHIFDEPLFDLVAICRSCHQRLHRCDEQFGPDR
jgi:hypothetical protein